MPRKRRTSTTLSGRDTYHVVGRAGELAVKGEAAHALTTAQGRALKMEPPVTLHVERRSVLGPAVTLYRVDRAMDRTVYTTVVNHDD